MNEITLTSDITVRLIQSMGGDHAIVAAAKVSTCGEDALKFADPALVTDNTGLINYLMKQCHGSPFECSAMTFFVHAPIFVWREWHRHRIGFSYNEESARYRPLSPTFWVPRRDRKMIPIEGWKPGRPKFRTMDEAAREMAGMGNEYLYPNGPSDFADAWYGREIERDRKSYQLAYDMYQESISDGIALEVARCKLPVGIYSSCWVTCNPRSLMNLISLRTHEPEAFFVSYPQAEIEEAVRVCESFLEKGWPITYAAFVKHGRHAP